jgi:iron complex outermembrane recepter protein
MKDVMAYLIKPTCFPKVCLGSVQSLAVSCMAFSFQGVQAQNLPAASTETPILAPVVVTSTRADRTLLPEFVGLGDASLQASPLSASLIDNQQIEALGAKRFADLIKTDASVSDAYNTVGYWDYATVRGFVISNKYNYRRDGLPISAETAIGLDNKASVEILKGTSGIQTGVSAPGGLVNYTVKRPTQTDFRSASLSFNSNGSVMGAADLGGRFGAEHIFGYRINAASDRLNHFASNTQGHRQLLALAGDVRLTPDTLLQAELEYAHRSQPSVPGLSVTGNRLPAPNAALNLNQQTWSQPVVLDGLTGSLKLEQMINPDWRWIAQMGSQKLRSQDRVAFPYGCSAQELWDRYCADGTFDMYDYRSDHERRSTWASQVQLKGQFSAGTVQHALGLGVLWTRAQDRLGMQAYNYVGTGSIYTPTPLPADPTLSSQSPQRNERSVEVSAYDAIQWNQALSTWLGLRYTQLNRASVSAAGTDETRYQMGFVTPWLALAYKIQPSTLIYASYGQGVESDVAPNLPSYTNAGKALPALKSKQFELGLKGALGQSETPSQWTAALFQIKQPLYGDVGACAGVATCTRQLDGIEKHRGLELGASSPSMTAAQPWQIDSSVSVIHAHRESAQINPSLNGLRPTNVPAWIMRLNAHYQLHSVPGLALSAHLSHEGARVAVADNSLKVPHWTRLDLALRYKTSAAHTALNWTLGVDNALNKTHFTESPTQFGHVYLFTSTPRTLRLTVQAAY